MNQQKETPSSDTFLQPWEKPALVNYGSVGELTQSGTLGSNIVENVIYASAV
jgi:hypothetical protein